MPLDATPFTETYFAEMFLVKQCFGKHLLQIQLRIKLVIADTSFEETFFTEFLFLETMFTISPSVDKSFTETANYTKKY